MIKGTQRGKRCFLIASGPSIKNMDLRQLKDEITICVNESYKALDFDPTYICIGDRELWPVIKDEYAKKKSKIVCSTGLNGQVGSDYKGNNLIKVAKLNKSKTVMDNGFRFDMVEVHKAWNVIPEVALPFVCYAGFSTCYLLGCDCTNDGYFYDDPIRGKGYQKVLDTVIPVYENIARRELPTRIYNATEGGRLEAFPRVNLKDVLFKPTPSRNPLTVIGYYTEDRNYKELAHNMKASVERQGIKCHIEKRTSWKCEMPKPTSWVLNCSQCSYFIEEMMKLFPDTNLLYLDADAVMEKRPKLFLDDAIDFDFGAPFLTNEYVKDELQSNTLFFRACDETKKLVQDWRLLQDERNFQLLQGKYAKPFKEAWDQRVLQDVLVASNCKIKKLPWEYGKITVTPRGDELMKGVKPEDIVISQHQASRQNKHLL